MSDVSQFIPAKRKTKGAKLKSVEAQSAIPKDLEDKWGACVACATAFNVVQNGAFAYSYSRAVGQTLAFLKKLHEQSVEDALKHPDAYLIPELKKELDKAGGKDGEKN